MVRRRSKATRISPRGAVSRWPAFVAGCVAGAAATVLIGSVELPRSEGRGGEPGASAQSGESAPSAELKYDFYTILPEMEAALPLSDQVDAVLGLAESAAPPAPAAAPETTAVAALEAEPPPEPESGPETALPAETPSAPVVEASLPAAPEPEKPVVSAAEAGGTYVLQVGSFRNSGEAERRRASLALLGLEARVQTIAIDGEAIWHRVQVGPYEELNALNNARVRLRENDIEAIALKVRKP